MLDDTQQSKTPMKGALATRRIFSDIVQDIRALFRNRKKVDKEVQSLWQEIRKLQNAPPGAGIPGVDGNGVPDPPPNGIYLWTGVDGDKAWRPLSDFLDEVPIETCDSTVTVYGPST